MLTGREGAKVKAEFIAVAKVNLGAGFSDEGLG